MIPGWLGRCCGARKDGDPDEGPAQRGFTQKVKQQLWIIYLCRLAEPVALTSTAPYLYFMIKSFNIPEGEVAFWVGLTTASFSFGQFATAMSWGRASDRFGRKPTLLFGLLGTMLSSLLFGFAKSPLQAIIIRSFAGLVNGNIAILRTLIAENVRERHLKHKAVSYTQVVWSAGAILGPLLGGYLADPVHKYPKFFSSDGFFSAYPYALPNLFSAGLFGVGAIISFLFLEESLEARKHDRDIGLELSRKIISLLSRIHRQYRNFQNEIDETTPLIQDEENARSPLVAARVRENRQDTTLLEAFSKEICLVFFVYLFTALQSNSFEQMISVYFALPRLTHGFDPSNPFKFYGGLGLSSSTMGFFFSIFGFISMFIQFFIVPPMTSRYGPLTVFRACLWMYPVMYFLSPLAVLVNERFSLPIMLVLLSAKHFGGNFIFPGIQHLLDDNAKSTRVLGTIHGTAVTVAALARGAGPTISGGLLSYGQRIDYLILPFWFMGCVSFIALFSSFSLVDYDKQRSAEGNSTQEPAQSAEQATNSIIPAQAAVETENSTPAPTPGH